MKQIDGCVMDVCFVLLEGMSTILPIPANGIESEGANVDVINPSMNAYDSLFTWIMVSDEGSKILDYLTQLFSNISDGVDLEKVSVQMTFAEFGALMNFLLVTLTRLNELETSKLHLEVRSSMTEEEFLSRIRDFFMRLLGKGDFDGKQLEVLVRKLRNYHIDKNVGIDLLGDLINIGKRSYLMNIDVHRSNNELEMFVDALEITGLLESVVEGERANFKKQLIGLVDPISLTILNGAILKSSDGNISDYLPKLLTSLDRLKAVFEQTIRPE